MELHTDQGKNVDVTLIRQLCDILEVFKTRTSAYHPVSNGQVESYYKIITQIIRCFLKKTQNRWNIHLKQLAGAIRATENRQTGFTPNFRINQPIDLVLRQIKERSPDQDNCKYVQSLRNSLEDARDIARENLKSAQKRQKQDYYLNLNFGNSVDLEMIFENKLEKDTNMELEDLYLDILFIDENQNNQNDLNSLSESLTDGFNNNDPFFVSDSLTTDSKMNG
ncbi:unnamed protein product [Mytilus edulis]|uniref:Integrase catalytic domain-containing protein n=1 Tax=Mytilus edulis TaxID=6550 RepID=A0A8S3TNV6_MYTED|nr:unnamed protein product [Mytilus edulis]